MAHSLHSLVLDVCCENSQFYPTKEEALKVLYASVFTAFTLNLATVIMMIKCIFNTQHHISIIPSVHTRRWWWWHLTQFFFSSYRRLVSPLSYNSPLPQACLAEGKFFVCDQISPIPDGKLLLNYIRNVSFTSKSSLPFNLSDIVNPNLVFVTTQQSQYSEDCTRLCHRNTENNLLRLHLSGAAIQFSSIYTFEEHYVQQQIILICNKRRLLLAAPPPRPWKLLNRGL